MSATNLVTNDPLRVALEDVVRRAVRSKLAAALSLLIPSEEGLQLLSIQEVSALLGIGRTAVYDLMRDGRLTYVKVGGRRLVPKSSMRTFVAGQTVSKGAEEPSEEAAS